MQAQIQLDTLTWRDGEARGEKLESGDPGFLGTVGGAWLGRVCDYVTRLGISPSVTLPFLSSSGALETEV